MTGIGYLGAFLGGVLTLLSPCSALLLPAFFAYAFASPARLLGRTAVFYAGLAGVLAPPTLDTWNNRLQDAVTAVQAHVPDLALIATVAAAVVAITAWRLHRVRRPQPTDTPGPAQQPALTEHAADEPAPERTP